MITPIDLLNAVDSAVSIFGDDCADNEETGLDLGWAVGFLLGILEGEGHVDDIAVVLERRGATMDALHVFREIQEFAGEGFTYGEVYDALVERVLYTAEATA